MDDADRIHLQRMIAANNVQDQTDKIRWLKHSDLIKKDVQTMLQLKKSYSRTQDSRTFESMCETRCAFLFHNYTDIYNRLKKNELNLDILAKLLDHLKKIEDGELDQHTGSFEVGKILKKMYIDSALKRAEKYDKQEKKKPAPKKEKKISWHDFKMMQNWNIFFSFLRK